MSANLLSIHLTDDGLAAFNSIVTNGDAFAISKVELSSNLTQPANPNDWFPDGGAGLPYYVLTGDCMLLKAARDNVFVMDMQLNQTVPANITYNPPAQDSGWVGSIANYINIGSFALYIIDPNTSAEIVFCIGYFSIETVQKFTNTNTAPGNFLSLFSNLEISPFSTDYIIYELPQLPNARLPVVPHLTQLNVPSIVESTTCIIEDVATLAYSNYLAWFFSSYIVQGTNLAIDNISGTQLTSTALYNALPATYQVATQTFSNNLLIAEIVDASGVMKQCAVLLSSSGNVFTANTSLPTLQSGDTVTLFILANYSATARLILPVVTTLAASTITGNSMLLNADLVSCGTESVVQCSFQYRIAGQSSWLSTATQNLNRYQTFSSTISGLTSNTTYEFRAVATGLSNPDSTVYGDILTATTLNVTPSDYVINIVGTTGSISNDPLNTTTVPSVVNGSVSNTTATITASADSCVATTKEYSEPLETFVDINTLYQINPLKLAIDGATTNTSIVVTSPIAGLLADGSTLWCDDGGTMENITAGNVVATTQDNSGAAWVSRTLPSSQRWTAVAYGNGTFVAVSDTNSNVAATSVDGVTWVQRTLPVTSNWAAIAYGNGIFVTVSFNTSIAATSSDGVNWTQQVLPFVANWCSIAYGNGVFVAITGRNANGTSASASTVDGVTWVFHSLPATIDWRAITYGSGLFLAVGAGVGSATTIYATSTNGATWTQRTLPTAAYWCSVTYGNGLFAAVSGSGVVSNVAATSTDGINWVQRTLPSSSGTWFSVAYGNGLFAALGWESPSSKVATSIDGINWTPKIIPSIANSGNISSGGGIFVIVSTGTTAITSNAGYFRKYTCTALSPSLSNVPTWVAKAGQVFKSSVTTSTSTTNFVVDTVNAVTRTGDMITLTTANRTINGSYVKLQVGLNQADTCTRLYAGFLV